MQDKINVKEKFLLENIDGAPLIYVDYDIEYKDGAYKAIINDFNNASSSIPCGALPIGNITIDKVAEILYRRLYNKYKSNYIILEYKGKLISTGKR